MNLLEVVRDVRRHLEANGRVSIRMLRRQYALDDDTAMDLIDELVDIQRVAKYENNVLVWTGEGPPAASTGPHAAAPTPPGVQRDARIYTPKHLADRILQSRSALEGERKQVTVLFADVKGSMELAEQLDPEEWHTILERFFAILTDGVHRFEGTVNQYTGDGIMALFGAPLAHEDHAQRACYAALHLRDALRDFSDALRMSHGLGFGFRIGMNSGEVVVGRIGDDLRMDYTAQGHTVGLAQRMEAMADSRSILLSANTARFVDGYFALRDLGAMQIKGIAETQHVFELEGLGTHRTRLDTSRSRGLSRFVGRRDEMATLTTALRRSLEGAGRVAAVVGEPGVGKSRLCAEFVDHCRLQGLRVFEAHCPAHGKSIPYLPLLELLRNLFGVNEQDSVREARQKIAGELALLDDAFADDRAMVLDFLGVADPNMAMLKLDPAVRQLRLFAFLRRLIQRRTDVEPLVILIDDLHWIDPGSDLFVAQIVEAVSSTRTLLLVNFRPEYEAEWTRRSWVLQLPMAPLGAAALAELVRDWVGTHASVAGLPELIGERSGGNPFFAEEIVLSLLDTGQLVGTRGDYRLTTAVRSLDVPPTVRSLLAARIDRLGEREKQVLYTAAVIGKTFSRPLLEAVMDPLASDLDTTLATLLQAEMVHERSLYPVAEYAFKHPLTHEVALHTQLGSTRRERHAAVATAIEAASPERLDERASLLAHHWQEAGDALRAAGWHVRAARWVRANDMLAAHRHWSQAQALLVPLAGSAERTQLLLEVYPEVLNMLHRMGADAAEADAIYQQAVDFARRAGARRTEALIEAAYGQLLTGRMDWERVIDHARRAVALAQAEGDLPVETFGRFVAGRGYLWSARSAQALDVLEPVAVKIDPDQGWDIQVLGYSPWTEALSLRAVQQAVRDGPAASLPFVERLTARLQRREQSVDLNPAAADRVNIWLVSGDGPRAYRDATEALAHGERFGSSYNIIYALVACGLACCLQQRWSEGAAFAERADAMIAEHFSGGSEWRLYALVVHARCLAGTGEHARSTGMALQAAREVDGILLIFFGFFIAQALRIAGGLANSDAIGSILARGMDAAERSGAHAWRACYLLERAALARLQGDRQTMTNDLAEARRLFSRYGMAGWEDQARMIEA